jgi:hypothetical protein
MSKFIAHCIWVEKFRHYRWARGSRANLSVYYERLLNTEHTLPSYPLVRLGLTRGTPRCEKPFFETRFPIKASLARQLSQTEKRIALVPRIRGSYNNLSTSLAQSLTPLPSVSVIEQSLRYLLFNSVACWVNRVKQCPSYILCPSDIVL